MLFMKADNDQATLPRKPKYWINKISFLFIKDQGKLIENDQYHIKNKLIECVIIYHILIIFVLKIHKCLQ